MQASEISLPAGEAARRAGTWHAGNCLPLILRLNRTITGHRGTNGGDGPTPAGGPARQRPTCLRAGDSGGYPVQDAVKAELKALVHGLWCVGIDASFQEADKVLEQPGAGKPVPPGQPFT